MNTSKIQIVPINAHSDGDISHQPKKDWRLVDPPHIYLEKVASLWMEKRGELKPGKFISNRPLIYLGVVTRFKRLTA